MLYIITYVLLHLREDALEGGSGVWTQLPASLDDPSQPASREEREGLEVAAAHTPHHTLSRDTLERLLQKNQLV